MKEPTGRTVVDLGATRVKFGYSPDSHSLKQRNTFRLDQYRDPLELFSAIRDGNPTTADSPWVIGVPSPVDGNRMTETPNLPERWTGSTVPEALSELGLDFTLENDANLAALGEFHFGAGEHHTHLVCLTLGTGIGGGIIIDGSLYRGHSGAAGEVGHITLVPGGRPCGCGNRGCFEQYGSASGLSSTYEQLTGDRLTAEEIARRHPGDDSAQKALEATGTHLGRGLAVVCNLLEPDIVVLAGGLSRSLKHFRGTLRGAFEENVFAERVKPTGIEQASLDEPALHGGLVLPLDTR